MKVLFVIEDNFITLYDSQYEEKSSQHYGLKGKKFYFEIKVLKETISKFGMRKKYLFESLLI